MRNDRRSCRHVFRESSKRDSGSNQYDRELVTLDRFRIKSGMTVMGFTMAEILLSLTIIGVVAAITLPSLTGNINERTWNTQRKALYARMSQAVSLMPALNGYADTETFLTSGLAKVLKINNICDSTHLADCGVASAWTDFRGSKIETIPNTLYTLNDKFNYSSYPGVDNHSVTVPDTNAAGFETANGESIIAYYNPQCIADGLQQYVQYEMCANFVYDLNGSKGPNTVGKDIGFITAMYPTDSSVVEISPLGVLSGASGVASAANNLCRERFGDVSRAPNYDESASIFINRNLLGIGNGSNVMTIWTTSACDAGKHWRVHAALGYRNCLNSDEESSAHGYFCIRRAN